MKFKVIHFLLFVLTLAPEVLQGADVTASWLQIPTSTRQAALSGAVGSMVEDVDALGTNPAGLAALSGGEISFLHNIWAQDLSIEHLVYGQGFGNSGFALGGDYFNFGQIDLYSLNSYGNPVSNGTFNPLGLDLYAGFGLEPLPGIRMGVDGKFILENLTSVDSSSTVAADFGFQYKLFSTGLTLGIALLNLGGTLEEAELPCSLDLSGAYQVNLGSGQLFSLGTDGNIALNDPNGTTVSLGGEYWYHDLVALRVGYRMASYGSLQGLTGLSAGVGMKLGFAELDYSITTLGEIGYGSQISLDYRFGPIQAPILPPPDVQPPVLKDGNVLLNWKASSESGVMGYNLYIQKPDQEHFRRANSLPLKDLSVTLKHLKPGETYRLGVSTVNRDGKDGTMKQVTLVMPEAWESE